MGDHIAPIGKDWKKGQHLGSGSFGSVYKAREANTGRIFAVKETHLVEEDADHSKCCEKMQAEVDICKSLRHPNIVSYLGHDQVDGRLCIFLEYVPGGSMASMLREFGPLSAKLLRLAARGCVEGLAYLHSSNPPVVHRDIKCSNILVDMDFRVKLADFGCSKQHIVTQSFTAVGSIPWMAPEVILQQDGFGRKADIWSFGCTLIEMATAQNPWGEGAFDNVIFALRHISASDSTPPVPTDAEAEAQDVISLCTRRDASERPSAADLLTKHKYLTGVEAR